MLEFARNAGALGVLLGLVALTGPLRGRWGWVSAPLALVALGLGLAWEMLHPALLSSILVVQPGIEIALWFALGWAVLRAGGPRIPSARLGAHALFMGALAGPWVSAALLTGLVEDRGQRARAILAASSASLLLSPAAHPLRLVLDAPAASVLPLALLATVLVWPMGELEREGSPMATAALLLAGLGCALSPLDLPVLVVALVLALLGGRSGAGERPPLTWLGGLILVLAVAQLAGSLHQAGVGADLVIGHRPWGPLALSLGSAGLHALMGEAGAALVLSSILDSVVVPRTTELPTLLLGGAVAGGGLMAVAAAGWRASLRPWAAQLLLVAIWAVQVA
ncbi:MAG: hypothetical protein H6741_03955 [Alphaproteobacteria bacterium]|nr:hypothetical protein [Alphaproteobacteria bacterium]MCB9791860.1 hypothetical protein [Alphaproteobacteria bacterium]